MKRGEIAELFERYGPIVYRRALSILRNPHEAEEATQEVFIRALKSKEGFEGRSKISTWLYSITTNYCLNQIRNESRRRELWQEHGPATEQPGAPLPDDGLVLQKLLSEADEQEARAAVYVYIDGMNQQEVAEILEVSRRTVGNLLDRFNTWAQKKLKDHRP
jgi:RNA polymerase sigma-70 factor (ECF subfamily)